MCRVIAAGTVVLTVCVAWYVFVLRATLAELHLALEEATSSLAQVSSELVVARQDADRLVDTLSVIGADQLATVELRGPGAASPARGRAFVSQGRGVVLRVSGIDVGASGHTLQLWAVTGHGPVSMGTFDVNPFGSASLTRLLPEGTGLVRAVWVTAPVAGGVPGADSASVLTGTLPAD